METCFSKYISSGFACETNPAKTTLRTLGISEAKVSKVIGEEYDTPQQLWQDKFDLCYHQMTAHALQKFQRGGRYANGLIERKVVGERIDGVKAGDGTAVFVMESKCPMDVALNINTLSLHLNYTGTVDVKVWNLTTGEELLTIPVEVVSGVFKRVNVFERISFNGVNNKIAIGYDSDGIESVHYRMRNDCITCPIKQCGRFIRGYGGRLENGKVTRTGHMAGMAVDYSLECDYEGFICANSAQLSTPLIYHIGAEIAAYALSGSRFNDHQKEEWERILMHCEEHYNASLERVLRSINLPNNDCFGCKSRFAIVNTTP
jgi:hypothetical protein